MIRRIIACAVLCLGFVSVARSDDVKLDVLSIYFIDADGGAATLLVTPKGESVLLDSGWPGLDDRDPKRIVQVLKNVAKLDHLDHLVTTHWHMDHFGGVAGLSKLIEIRQFWDRGLPDLDKSDGDSAAYPDGPKKDDPLGIAYREASKGKRKALRAGDRLPLKDMDALVLTSGGKVIDVSQRYPSRSEGKQPVNPNCATSLPDNPLDPSDNARSLSLLFSFGKFQFLDCGDLTWNVEKRLVCPTDLIGPVDLFQVTHHGMDISNHPTLLQTIAPTVAIMDNGPKKGGGPATVRNLKALPSIQALYQLHKNAKTKPEENTSPDLIANTDPAGGEYISVRVAPDGSSFEVKMSGSGRARQFTSK